MEKEFDFEAIKYNTKNNIAALRQKKKGGDFCGFAARKK
jgi:hypothetical protein